MMCKFCGKYIESDRAFCAKCGRRYSKAVSKLNMEHIVQAKAQFITPLETPKVEAEKPKTAGKKRLMALLKR